MDKDDPGRRLRRAPAAEIVQEMMTQAYDILASFTTQ
jgi:hypothetical protein